MSSLDLIFRDYEVQMKALQQLELEAEGRENAQYMTTKLTFSDRLAAQLGHRLILQSTVGERWEGTLTNLGLGWLQLTAASGEIVLPMETIEWWSGGNKRADVRTQEVARQLSFSHALRAIARSRKVVTLMHKKGNGGVSEGKIRVVGIDYCELQMLVGSLTPNEPQGVSKARVIPFSSIAALKIQQGSGY